MTRVWKEEEIRILVQTNDKEFHSYEVYPEKMGYNALTAFGLQG